MQNNILKLKRRMLIILIGVVVASVILIGHTAYIQFVRGEELQMKAYGQQLKYHYILLQFHLNLDYHFHKIQLYEMLNLLLDKIGNDLVLTIDKNIQAIVEKYLEDACIDNVCTDGGNVINNGFNRAIFAHSF